MTATVRKVNAVLRRMHATRQALASRGIAMVAVPYRRHQCFGARQPQHLVALGSRLPLYVYDGSYGRFVRGARTWRNDCKVDVPTMRHSSTYPLSLYLSPSPSASTVSQSSNDLIATSRPSNSDLIACDNTHSFTPAADLPLTIAIKNYRSLIPAHLATFASTIETPLGQLSIGQAQAAFWSIEWWCLHITRYKNTTFAPSGIYHKKSFRSRENAEKASALLYRLLDEQRYHYRQRWLQQEQNKQSGSNAGEIDGGASKLLPTIKNEIITLVIDNWRIVAIEEKDDDAVLSAEALLLQIQKDYDDEIITSPLLTRNYNAVMDAYSKSSIHDAALQAEKLLRRLQQHQQQNEQVRRQRQQLIDNDNYGKQSLRNATPDLISYNTVLNAFSRSALPNAADRAMLLMDEMKKEYRRSKNSSLAPDTVSYTTLIDVYGKRGTKKSALQAEKLLQTMKEEYNNGENRNVNPNSLTYACVACAWIRTGLPESAHRVDNILREIEELYRDGDPRIMLDLIFHSIIHTYAKTGQNDAGDKAEGILIRMSRLIESMKRNGDYDSSVDLLPNSRTYTLCIDAHAKSGKHNSAEKAEAILRHMISEYESGKQHVKPNIYTFTSVIDALSSSGRNGSGKRAKDLITTMNKLSEFGNDDIRPNCKTWSSVIAALAKDPTKGSLLEARNMLFEMQRLYETGERNDLKPTAVTMTSLLHGFYLVGDFKNALEFLDRWEQKAQLKQVDGQPDTVSYNLCLSALSRGPLRGVGEQSASLLRRMRLNYSKGQVQAGPDRMSYNIAIKAWSRSKRHDSISRAEKVLDEMLDDFHSGNLQAKPDIFTYNALLHVYAKSNQKTAARKAAKLLQHLLKEFQSGDSDIKPDNVTFHETINCWARHGGSQNGQEAKELLNQMKELSLSKVLEISPTSMSYNCTLNAFATSVVDTENAKWQLFRDLVALVDEMKKNGFELEVATYGICMRACAELLPPGSFRDQNANEIFERCFAAGLVNDRILKFFWWASPVSFDSAARRLGIQWKHDYERPSFRRKGT